MSYTISLRTFIHNAANEMILIRMLLAFGMAILEIVPALYLSSKGFSGSSIGFIMGGVSALALLANFGATMILEKVHEYTVFTVSIALSVISLIWFAIVPSVSVFLFYLFFTVVTFVVRVNAASIIFKDITNPTEFTDKASLLSAILNIGWFVGPIISGVIMASYGVSEVFILAAVLYGLALLIALCVKIEVVQKKRAVFDMNILQNIRFYFSRPGLRNAYILAMASTFWYTMTFVFMPLFIVQAGLGEEWVGIFVAATQLPLIVVQVLLGKAIRRWGTRHLFMWAYGYLACISIVAFFVPNMYVVMAILASSAIALGAIEPLREIYFYKQVTLLEEEKTYPVFRTSYSFGSILGKVLLGALLFVLPQAFVFVCMSLVMVLTMGVAMQSKNYQT